MALLRKLNTKATTDSNTGFGNNAADYGGRFLNKDGTPNLRKTGLGFFEHFSIFHTLLALPRWKFLLMIFLFYIIINLFFAFLYLIIGIEHLGGVITLSKLEQFGEAFFFSAQTFTTVGYGRINPTGFLASTIASFEALLGLLSLAIATGLLYGRFSKPKAFVKFSDNAVIAPFNNGTALMIRLAPYKNNSLTDAEVKITLAMLVEENGKMVNKFFSLKLEVEKITALPLSWTIVHPINDESPLYQFSENDFATTTGEVFVYLKAFDDMFSNMVLARTSYTFKEIIYGAKFAVMFHRSGQEQKTILDLNKLNLINKQPLSNVIDKEILVK